MKTNDFTRDQIIELAALIEQRGAKLYTEAIKKTEHEAAANILRHLAEQEKEHEQVFQRLYDDIAQNRKVIPKDINDEAVGYLGSLVPRDVFPSADEDFIKKILTIDDAIKAGLKAEKDSILFYTELSVYGWDSDTQRILRGITSEERKHLVQLQELQSLIDERGVYY